MEKANRTNAEKLHKEASGEHELTKTETIKLRAEVAQLEKEKKDRGFMQKPDYVKDTQLNVATQKLATSETSLATASTKLAEAADFLDKRQKEETKIKGNVAEKTSAKAAQQAYGESLQKKTFLGVSRAPYDWTTAAGSARREAANKIKTSKPTKDQLVDLVKKIQKEDEEEANKADKNKDKGEDKSGDKKNEKDEKTA